MFCFQCGFRLPEHAKFCLSCGVQITAKTVSKVSKSRVSSSKSAVVSPAPSISRVAVSSVAAGPEKEPATGGAPGPEARRPGVRAGDLLADRFLIEQAIGRGGCGEVFLATDQQEGRKIALKVVTFDAVSGPSAFEEVRRELVVRDKVNDFAHILRTYGFFTLPSFGGFFLLLIAMELAPFGSLRSWLRENRNNLDQRRLRGVDFLVHICRGVKTLHASGLVHLDLKPENILLCGDAASPTVKVGDFELTPTAEQRVMNEAFPVPAGWGTFAYKSPEQFLAPRQEELLPTSDIYSIGTIMFEIFDPHGKPPFDGSPQDLQRKHVEVPPPRIKGLDEKLENILRKCLAKKPEDRFQSADQLLGVLQNIQHLRMACPGLTAARPAQIMTAVSQSEPPPQPPTIAVAGSRPEEVMNAQGLRLRLIKPGSFLMGSNKGGSLEGPVHEVTLTRPFYLGADSVTQQQYESVMGMNQSYFNWPNRPVENVTWEEAVEFCRRLSESEGIRYRLPTEAEWEYACRAGSTSEYPWGDKFNPDYAWCVSNSGKESHDASTRMPNPWGLYDMCGNIWEWCQDWYGNYPSEAVTDPVGPDGGSYRVLRGGSWSDSPEDCRAATRGRADPVLRLNVFGFRVVREVGG